MSEVIRIHEHGGPESLRLEETEVPDPGPGQARVRHHAIGVNFIDTYHRTGLYPLAALPHGLGIEGAGVVEAVGDDVTVVAPGDRVAYASGTPGAYAALRILPAEHLVRLPDDVDDETAAAVLLKGMTVEYLIRRTYRVRPGQTVLLHAAAGGVGLVACQWLAHLDATIIGTVGSDEKAELAKAHGCHYPVVYTREDFVQRVGEITTGRGVPVVYDSVGRATVMGSLDCLQPRGMLVSFGNASGKPDPLDIGLLAQKGSLFVTRPVLGTYIADRNELLQSAEAVFELVRSGALRVVVRQRWPLSEVAEAHRALEGRRTTGASLLLPP